MQKYETEREGQLEFFDSYIKLIDKELNYEDILGDNTDGIINGNILEFKLTINNLNAVLFQTIKYLSALRVKGKEIPANIILISLNDKKAYLYNSSDYLNDIQKIYDRSASLSNEGFICGDAKETLFYEQSELCEARLIELLRSRKFTKIDLDEDCIVGWASRYYRENPHSKKSDFIGDLEGKVKIIGEIRRPTKFKEFINPYKGKTNEKFKYLMDKLNDSMQKKDLGAFYTPDIYCKKSLELLRLAIKSISKEKDYIILDRCAGTGNLERNLTIDELSHCVLSTYEYYEYKVLVETLGDKVRHIIPPTEKEDTFNAGLVRGADALSEEYYQNEIIKKYIDLNKENKCAIIVFENPPYAESNGTTKINSAWKKSYVLSEMKKEIKGTATNDLGNAFIWSAFNRLLNNEDDFYLVFSPVKYWKYHHLVNKKFVKGFGFNRRFFHTGIDAFIMCALWQNINDDKTDKIILEGYDIIENELQKEPVSIPVKKIFSTLSDKYYDKRSFPDDETNGICTELNGSEYNKGKEQVKKIYNDNIVCYICANSSGFDNPDLNSGMTIAGRYDGHGFFARKDNYLEKMPLFAASRYITYNRAWTERTRIMKSGDGSDAFKKAVSENKIKQELLKCLLFNCLEIQNHCRFIKGSDGRIYKNQICLDTTAGETIAARNLGELKKSDSENELILQWNKVLTSAKKTKSYNNKINYGVYQIFSELNTFYKDEEGTIHYDYPELNGNLSTLKALVKNYYNTEIVPFLFKYEFLK